ncbi:MAG: 4Fe-4S binding protein, partial [Vicinamibacterales bacterium]
MLAGQPADPWGFEDEAVETWADILGPQYLDIALLAAFLVLALVSFKRKSVPLKLVTFAFAIGYMGFAKSYLISITNIFSIVDWNWPVPKYNVAWYLFFGFTVVSTILWGRLYCGRICAYGALTQS